MVTQKDDKMFKVFGIQAGPDGVRLFGSANLKKMYDTTLTPTADVKEVKVTYVALPREMTKHDATQYILTLSEFKDNSALRTFLEAEIAEVANKAQKENAAAEKRAVKAAQKAENGDKAPKKKGGKSIESIRQIASGATGQ